jgi:hypothetical protein
MKNRSARAITVIALVATMGASVPTVALAASIHSSVSAKTSPTSTTDRLAWRTWHASWMTYIQGIKSINANFRASVESMRSAFNTTIAGATTKSDRTAARVNLNKALSAALDTRVAAITAAGNPPAPPVSYNRTGYVTGIQNANVTFRSAITAAQSVYAQAILSATTVTQRSAAHAALRLAINNATTTRADALTALGTPPLNPGKKSA